MQIYDFSMKRWKVHERLLRGIVVESINIQAMIEQRSADDSVVIKNTKMSFHQPGLIRTMPAAITEDL